MRLTRTNVLEVRSDKTKPRGYVPVVMLTLTACATTGAPMVEPRMTEQQPKVCDGQEGGCRRPEPKSNQATQSTGLAPEPIGIALEPAGSEPPIVTTPKLIPTPFPGITLIDGLTTDDDRFLTAFTPTAKASRFKAGDTVPLDDIERVLGKIDRSKPTMILIGRKHCSLSQIDEDAMKRDRLTRKVNVFVFMEDSTNRDHPAKKLFFDDRFNCPTVILLDKTGTIVLFTEEIGGPRGYRKEFAAAVREVAKQ